MKLKELTSVITIGDKILFLTLIILSLSGIIFIKEVLPRGRTVLIEVDGKPVYVLSIEKDKTLSIKGPIGYTIVEIKNRKVRVKESPCHNKLCIKQGWIDRGVIVCIPNKVVVKVGNSDDKNNSIIDAITG